LRPDFSILVPTLGRADALRPLAENIHTVTEWDYELIFVLDHADKESLEAAKGAAWSRHIFCDGTYAEKTNAGYRACRGEWIVPTADDVLFRPEWDVEAVDSMASWVHVIGTNDRTPITADGTHATMPIIRREYIESPGCSWNVPGDVFFEGYHHGWVETEVCQLAQHRDCWTFNPCSVIEHRHPDWGTREPDATDEKGNRRNKTEDLRLFETRKAGWLAR
jgi:glycosyltransferase involved in cell wall biosynthesis